MPNVRVSNFKLFFKKIMNFIKLITPFINHWIKDYKTIKTQIKVLKTQNKIDKSKKTQ